MAVSPVAEAGGAEVLLTDILCGLVALQCRVTLVVMGNGPLERIARQRGLPVVMVPALSFRRAFATAKQALWLRRLVLSERPDVVLGSHAKGQLIVRLACAGTGTVQITQLYDPPATSASSRLAARLGGSRLAISEETAAAHAARNSRTHPLVIRPGRDFDILKAEARAGEAREAWRRSGLKPTGPRVVTAIRLQRFKGPFQFIDMADRVLAEHPTASFLIIGLDSPIEPHLRRELQEGIAQRGLGASVAVVGALSPPDLAATIADATLLVHAAEREPFGMIIVEALSLGTPVVAYDAPGPRSILGHGGGSLVAVGDVSQLAEVVAKSLADPVLLDHWAHQGPGIARRFGVSDVAHRYLEVLRQVANGNLRQSRVPLPGRPVDQASPGLAEVVTIGSVPPGPSGIRDHGRLLADALRQRGVAMRELWFRNDGLHAVELLRLSVDLARLGTAMTPPKAALWHYNPVSYGYRGVPGPCVLVGALLRARGCRVVTMLHELAYSWLAAQGWRAMARAVSQRLALEMVLLGSTEVVVSTDLRQSWLSSRRFGVRRPVHVVPVFNTVPVAPGGSAKPSSDFTLGVLAYSGDGVRPDVLIDALVSTPDVRTLLIGAPGPESSAGRWWRSLAHAAGVDSNLAFTGVVDPAVFSECLQRCSLVVLVNEEGPSSRKTTLAVALAHGLPVISLDGPNRWDDLASAEAIRLVDGPVELRVAIEELRKSTVDRRALASRGREFYDQRMSLEGATTAFATLLQES